MFSTKLETVQSNKKLDNSRVELANLGSIKENLKIEIDELTKLASHYNGIDKKVEEAEIELQRLNKEIAKANHLKSDLEIVESKLNETKELNATISSQTKELLAKHDKLSADIKILEDKQVQNKVEFDSAVLSYKNEISKYETALSEVTEKTKKAIEEHGIVITKNKAEIDVLVKTVNELEQAKDGLDKKITESKKELTDIDIKIIKQQEFYKNLIIENEAQAENILSKAEEMAKNKAEELIVREGDLSQREAWLNEKESKLLDLKTKMEAFHGKKIDNINI